MRKKSKNLKIRFLRVVERVPKKQRIQAPPFEKTKKAFYNAAGLATKECLKELEIYFKEKLLSKRL